MPNEPQVAHLDHVSEPGGAELALARMLRIARPWTARLLLPRGTHDGADAFFSPPLADDVSVMRVGPAQPSGASKSRGATKTIVFASRILAQAVALRTGRALRGASVVHSNSTRSAVYGALAVLGTRRGFVVHLRDMVTPEALGAIGHRLFTRLALARADAVIANSEATLESARPYLTPSVAVHVIPSASGLKSVAEVAPQPEVIGSIGMVARIDHWKGQHLLIEAFARADLPPATRLRLAGSTSFGTDDYLRELRTLAETLGVADRVDFLGHVEDVNGFIDEVDICVQSSVRPEPLGQNVLQYLARAKPTITTNVGGPAAWIDPGVNGEQFEIGSVEDLAAKLTAVAGDRALRDGLAHGASRTAGLEDDTAVTSRHGEVFAAVAKSRGVKKA